MTTSSYVTQNDLVNIFNEILPTPRYGGIYSASWTSSSHSAFNVRVTNNMTLPAGTYVVIIISPYISAGTAFICPRVNGITDAKHLLSCPTGGVHNGAFIISLDTTSTVAVYSEGSASVTYSDIGRAGLYAIQISDASYNTNQADYIVEQGTSGIWTYRKWNSGIAECWGYYYKSVAANTSDSSNYVTYPFSFTAVPNITLGLYAGGADLYRAHVTNSETNTSQARLTLINKHTAAVGLGLWLHIIGAWK